MERSVVRRNICGGPGWERVVFPIISTICADPKRAIGIIPIIFLLRKRMTRSRVILNSKRPITLKKEKNSSKRTGISSWSLTVVLKSNGLKKSLLTISVKRRNRKKVKIPVSKNKFLCFLENVGVKFFFTKLTAFCIGIFIVIKNEAECKVNVFPVWGLWEEKLLVRGQNLK